MPLIPTRLIARRRHRIGALLAAAIVVALPVLARHASASRVSDTVADSLTPQLVAREKAELEALRRQDWTAYAAFLAPNYQEVGLEGYHTRSQALAAIKQMRLSRYMIADARTISVTKDVAVITYRGTLIGTFGGAPMQTAPFSYHDVWVRDGSEWRVVFSEETR